MRKLLLRSESEDGPVWMDARLSSGGIPFDELPQAPGFPCFVPTDTELTIDIGDHRELFYRRALDETSIIRWNIYRIALPLELDTIRGIIR